MVFLPPSRQFFSTVLLLFMGRAVHSQKLDRKRPSVYITFNGFIAKTQGNYLSQGARLLLHNNPTRKLHEKHKQTGSRFARVGSAPAGCVSLWPGPQILPSRLGAYPDVVYGDSAGQLRACAELEERYAARVRDHHQWVYPAKQSDLHSDSGGDAGIGRKPCLRRPDLDGDLLDRRHHVALVDGYARGQWRRSGDGQLPGDEQSADCSADGYDHLEGGRFRQLPSRGSEPSDVRSECSWRRGRDPFATPVARHV